VRPWKTYGECPSTAASEKGHFGGQSDPQKKPFTAEDIRFTRSEDGPTLYALVLAFPVDGKVTIKSLAANSPHWDRPIRSVQMLGIRGALNCVREADG
jgi:alpha-L-fucosidase